MPTDRGGKFPNVPTPDDHDPETCPTCAPILRSQAYQRGAHRARTDNHQETQP